MSLYSSFEPAQPDPILGLSAAFARDERPGKINLAVGVYKDSDGKTPVLSPVKEAEGRLLTKETSKGYLPMEGGAVYGELVRDLLFGSGHPVLRDGRARTAHTPGGTGALRLAADFIARHLPGRTIWMSDPTWANHPQIFHAARLQTNTYPYYDAATHGLNSGEFLSALEQIPEGDILLLHACCHNPAGADPDPETWEAIARVAAARGLVPLVDFAYQGFGEGIEADSVGLRLLAQSCPEFFVASSFSKNFGLYAERVGALTLVAANAGEADTALGHLVLGARTNYSNPPLHGSAIVCEILTDSDLRRRWEQEVADMRNRINHMRTLFVDTLAARGVSRDFSFLTREKGMFSFSGLDREQVDRLREEFAIYIVGSGRINVAGMTEDNMEPLCEAIAAVL